ncbi:hypothetical protein CYR40_14395 [Chimaeribacter arupi]|uniref:DUF2498 domain-containing protein n=2 Tax=Yersiniaceae TaxID=1903411 RepID=A0A2N5ESP5_9GAMM|nr:MULTISPECIES: YciN family protein [Yersiniaceae]MBS0970148.1 YciN family protein [Nissabacter archeti]MDV5138975.1 YciN family protein [Chimaeribacter arupi]PLR32949.1 hypothetical protein CYR23_13275 [Chimaeribacter arupi]PLR44834.1 hypothetical protein CYR40_14395 [Chimaeribacter arupi]PLR49412.1 hypothetical protein CYR52_12035 [Chimaeribacter arupi]
MNKNRTAISKNALLDLANNIIKTHEDYLHGMVATDVRQNGDVLVFSGEFFLDQQGLPTAKSTAVFNMFKHLAHQLSDKYYLEN